MAKPSKPVKPLAKPAPARPTTGLGRGLSDIIAQGARTTPTTSAPAPVGASVRQISLSQIRPNPKQPRVRFIEEPLDELVLSVQEHGVLQPITVRPVDNFFEIIAGERRFRACQKAGLAAIPAIVKAVSDLEAYELALIENLQREDLDPVEEARGYKRLAEEFSLTQEQIAQKLGKNRATVANLLRLLELPEEILGYLVQGRLSTGHAKAILSISDASNQIRIAHEILKNGLNVRQAEALVAGLRSPGARPSKKSSSKNEHETPAHLRAVQDALQQKLATRVKIQTVGNGGRIEIAYFTPSDLERLLDLLQIQL
jgi:ParB family transcriptional regulator, chromosome partitioning protein